AALPPLPAGSYRAYADVVHENGFAETMTESVTLEGAAGAASPPSDADDAMWSGAAADSMQVLEGGARLTWLGARLPHAAVAAAGLRFAPTDASGALLDVEPYLGMAAHAVIARADGGVYVHLHPLGTASLGAQQALLAWSEADTSRGAIRDKMTRARPITM